jgi:hypothetical protein
MNKIIAIAIVCLLSAAVYADRWEYTSLVGDTIYDPPLGSTDTLPVDDSIFVPIHVNIDDINIYVGITTYMYWTDKIDIIVFSPQELPVYLSHYSPDGPRRPHFNIWFDTDDSVDGPGVLQNYNGADVHGWWRMRCYSVSYMPPHTYWREWKIEVYGTPSGADIDESGIPLTCYLAKPYPNPFNCKAVLNFGMPQTGLATIAIYDILGRKISVLVDQQLSAGKHQITFDATDLASGVYFAKLITDDKLLTQRLVLVK